MSLDGSGAARYSRSANLRPLRGLSLHQSVVSIESC